MNSNGTTHPTPQPGSTTAPVSAYADPDGEAPWAMQLVAHTPKPTEHQPAATHTDTLQAAASATVTLLHHIATQGTPDEQQALDRWLEGRIRKVVRRARGAAFEAAAATCLSRSVVGTATVCAYLPGPTDQVPAVLRKLQVTGLALDDPQDGPQDGPQHDPQHDPGDPGVVVLLNPHVDLSTGKAAAQVAHAAQLVYQTTAGAARDAWAQDGAPVTVRTPDPTTWAALSHSAPVSIVDAGFTEIPPGTQTCVAQHPFA